MELHEASDTDFRDPAPDGPDGGVPGLSRDAYGVLGGGGPGRRLFRRS